MTVETTKLMTADELLAMPNDGIHRHELVRGELLTMSPSGAKHSAIALRIGAHLLTHVMARRLGMAYGADAGFIIKRNPDTVRAPDASFVRAERVVKTTKYFPAAPDLAVEVISPNDTYTEVRTKVREYLAAGTRMVVVVDIDEQVVTVNTSTGTTELTIDDTLTGGDVVPGWQLPLREIFAD